MLLSNSSMFWPFSGHVFRSILPEIWQESVRITSLSCVLSIKCLGVFQGAESIYVFEGTF